MPGRTTSTPKKEKSKKEIQTILEQSVDGWMKVGKKVGKNLSPILAEKEDNVTGTGGLKRTISGKTPGRPDSLLTQTSVLGLGEAAFSPPRKRFSSDSSAAESELPDLDVFDKHAQQFEVFEEEQQRELIPVPANLLDEPSDLTKRGEERRVDALLGLVEKFAAPSEGARLEWDTRGDLDRSLYTEGDDMEGVEPLELRDGDFEDVEEDEELSKTTRSQSITPVNPFMQDMHAELAKMTENALGIAMAAFERKWADKFLSADTVAVDNANRLDRIEAEQKEDHQALLHLQKDNSETSSSVAELRKALEENISSAAAKDAVINNLVEKINDLSTAVAQLTAKSELQQKEIENIKNGAISAPIAGNAADNGEGFQFSESEMKDLKGVITQFKRNETAYWGRSIKVSNIGSIPKEGNRFVSIKENLRKFGIEFLMTHAESFYVYSNSAVRITFKSYLDRNHLVSRARQFLKNLENKTVCLDTLLSPEHFPKKKQLLQAGKNMKNEGLIKKFSCELYRGTVMLRTVTNDGKVDWVDVNTTVVTPSATVRGAKVARKGLKEVGRTKGGEGPVTIDPRVVRSNDIHVDDMDIELPDQSVERDESL